MITRVEIDGFKSFHKFAVDFRSFLVVIGPNGVGKTNLFDAITLLAHLAGDNTVEEALRHARGENSELFTLYSDGTRAKTMSFAVEMLIEPTVRDLEGVQHELTTTRLRYELELVSKIEGGRDRVYVASEGLLPLKESDDRWVKDLIPTKMRKARILREKRPPFIATVGEENDQATATIYRNQDAPGGGKEGTAIGAIDRTILSTSHSARYPTIHAVRQEMQHWRFLQFNPAVMRMPGPAASAPGSTRGVSLLPDGSNLVALLSRLQNGTPGKLSGIVKDLREFIPTIADIRLSPVPDREDLLIEIEMQDKQRFSSRVVSDGTLRLLALVALKNDPDHRGAICFEEPENGVQPLRLRQTMDVLFALSTDFTREESSSLRQVLINTHSPGLLASAPGENVFYMHMRPEARGRASRVVPVRPELIQDPDERYYTWEQVRQYLDSSGLDRKRDELGL